jgi:23S rRNA (guanosine2251-2'-O)-methyltransferase
MSARKGRRPGRGQAGRAPQMPPGDSASLVVGGPNVIESALEVAANSTGRLHIFRVLLEDGAGTRARAIAERASELGLPVSSAGVGECDHLAGVRCQGIAAEMRFAYSEFEDVLEAEPQMIVFLDEILDPHNLGAILRSAEAAGADAVVIPSRRAAQMNATVMRVSAGAAAFLPLCRVNNLVRAMEKASSAGFRLLGLHHQGEAVLNPELGRTPQPTGLVLGGESDGLRRLVRERCDSLVRIEMRGRVESLNASVAAGVAVFTLMAGAVDTPRRG